ncbi:hypothetical protein [uncultured Desulfovibrio sp.]|uniref:hypothetical protein n=1 Tax=Desulfovibrio sp. SGI.230 TaxID=3420562 RepID=UPI002619C9DD|nr:hypothetical protein [uncultured Desulfovibrio sp.]
MKELTNESIRYALRNFGKGGEEISHAMLFEAFGLTEEGDKARLRNRINDMARMGEVVKVRPGVYTYNFGYRPRENRSLPAIWRFVRKAKPGWCLKECALMVRVDYTRVLRYAAWLEEQGYIQRIGRNGKNAVTYRGTSKADMTPETPYPPYKETDPFQKERAAAATIARLLLCADPYAKKTAQSITEACKVLLARFDKNRTENENEETEE